jgi:polyferredoxin
MRVARLPRHHPIKVWGVKVLWNWRQILRRAWSIRLILLAGLFSGLEVAFAVFADSPPIPRGTFASLSGLTTMAAFIARVIAQKDVSE